METILSRYLGSRLRVGCADQGIADGLDDLIENPRGNPHTAGTTEDPAPTWSAFSTLRRAFPPATTFLSVPGPPLRPTVAKPKAKAGIDIPA